MKNSAQEFRELRGVKSPADCFGKNHMDNLMEDFYSWKKEKELASLTEGKLEKIIKPGIEVIIDKDGLARINAEKSARAVFKLLKVIQ